MEVTNSLIKKRYIAWICITIVLASFSTTIAYQSDSHPTLSFGKFPESFNTGKIRVQPIQITHDTITITSPCSNNQITWDEQDETYPSLGIDHLNNLVLLYSFGSNDGTSTSDIYLRRSLNNGQQWPADSIWTWETPDISEIHPKISMADDGKRAYGTHEVQGGSSYLYLHKYNPIDDPDKWVMSHFDLTPEVTNVRDTTITTYGKNTIVIGGTIDLAYHEFRLKNTIVLFWNSNNSEDRWPGLFLINEDENNKGTYFPISELTADTEETIFVAFKLVDENLNNFLYVAYCPGNDTIFENWDLAFVSGGRGNISNPYISATKDRAYIVFQEEKKGDNNIVCYTSSSGSFWRRSIVASSMDDEINPVISAYKENAVCLFSKNGNLYESRSENGGITWNTPVMINNNDGTVNENSGSIDVEGIYGIWTDTRRGNKDLFISEVGALPILAMGDISGGFSIRTTVSNVGNIPIKDTKWSIEVQGPAFPVKKTGVIQTLNPGDEKLVKMNFLFGLGKITITITAGDLSKTVTGFAAGSFVSISSDV